MILLRFRLAGKRSGVDHRMEMVHVAALATSLDSILRNKHPAADVFVCR
jgi:hypothetical protein